MERLHVVAAAVMRANTVFVAKRPPDVHQGGLWEFPGGKVEPGEAAVDAVRRELREEIGIEPHTLEPLIQVPFDYPDRRVLLDVWRVTGWNGEPHGAEGQVVEWVELAKLQRERFPAANVAVVTALQLPPVYLITAEPVAEDYFGLRALHRCLQNGVRLVQLRARNMSADELRPLVIQYTALCTSYGARLLINSHHELVLPTGAHGAHLSAADLTRLQQRPLHPERLLAVSCHNRDELERAVAIGADFAVLSPLKPTTSHASATPLGWQQFQSLARDCPIPVYALGGLGVEDLADAKASGAQGVAGISNLRAHYASAR